MNRCDLIYGFSYDDLKKLAEDIDRGYRHFCRKRGLDPEQFVFRDKIKADCQEHAHEETDVRPGEGIQ